MAILTATVGGLQIRTADQLVPSDGNLILDNAALSGEGSARKAPGFERLPSATAAGGTLDPYHIAYRGTDLVAWGTDDMLYSFDEPAGVWRPRGPWTVTDLRIAALSVQRGAQVNVLAEVLDNSVAVTWQENPFSLTPTVVKGYVSVQDVETGATLLEATEVDPGGAGNPRQVQAIAADSWWLILWRTDSAIRYRTLRRDTMQMTAPATLLATTLGPAAATAWLGDQVWVTTMAPAGPSRTIRSWRVERDGALTSLNSFTSSIDRNLQVWASPGRSGPTMAGVTAGDQVEVRALNQFGNATGLATAGTVSPTGAIAADQDLVLGETIAARPYQSTVAARRVGYSGLTPTIEFIETVPAARVAVRPFSAWGREWAAFYAPAEFSDSGAYFLRELGGSQELLGGHHGNGQATVAVRELASRVEVVDNLVRYGVPFRDDQTSADASGALVSINRPQVPFGVASQGGSILTPSGGVLTAYDGRDAPYGVPWLTLPEIEVSVSAGVIPAGTYAYAVYWEWEDAFGQVNQSAPFVTSVTFESPGSLNITVFGAPPTRRSGVRIGVARSVNPGDASVLHEVTDYTFSEEPVIGSSIGLNDNLSNDDAAARPIYSQAGSVVETPNSFVPSAGPVLAAAGRVWTGDPEVAELVHFTKPFASGFAPAITPADVIGTTLADRVTAIAAQDGAIYAFSQSAITYWSGEGPDSFGAAVSPFSSPAALPVAQGVESQLYVTTSPQGMLYVSPRGPRLVGRDRAGIAPFGAVNEQFEFGGQLPGQVVYSPADEATFILAAAQNQPLGPVALAPRTLRYDHGTGRWSTEQLMDSTAIAVSADAQLVHLRAGGAVCRVTPDQYLRDGLRSALVVGTSWLKPALEREITIRRLGVLGRWLSPHLLVVGLSYDYDDEITDTFTIDPARDDVRQVPTWQGDPGDTWSGDTPTDFDPGSWAGASTRSGIRGPITRYQFRLNMDRTCHAVRVIVWDVTDATTGTGPSYALSAIQVEYDPGTQELREIDERLTY